MANQVTLTFAGDTRDVERAFDRVGSASDDMGRRVRESGDSFDKAAERADAVDTKAMGFRDTLTGIQDGAKGIKQAAAGDWGFETLLLLGFGLGDLASGMFNLVIPAVKSMTAAIRGMNLAFLSSPVFWIIAAIVILIGVIVLIARRTDWFSRAWRASWGWITRTASAAWNGIRSGGARFMEWIGRIPGWTRSAFRGIANIIMWPYRTAFNMIARAWNNTVGRLSWSVPGWVPIIGGNSISVPRLPTFHAGGRVPGNRGEVVPVLAMGGERFGGMAEGSGAREQWIRIDLGDLGDALLRPIAAAVGRRGGQATQLGIRVVR